MAAAAAAVVLSRAASWESRKLRLADLPSCPSLTGGRWDDPARPQHPSLNLMMTLEF